MLKSVREPSKALAAALMVLLLGVVGVVVFLWMAGTGWQDVHGVVVGVIFILLSLAQSVFGIFWYRAAKRDALKRSATEDAITDGMSSAKEMDDIRRSPVKEADKSKGTRESAAPLLTNRESASVVEVDAVKIQANSAAQVESLA